MIGSVIVGAVVAGVHVGMYLVNKAREAAFFASAQYKNARESALVFFAETEKILEGRGLIGQSRVAPRPGEGERINCISQGCQVEAARRRH